MLKRYRSAAIAVTALLVTSTVMYAAGNWSTLPVVGGSSYCASTVTGTGGLGGITGQGQGTLGSICAQTVPPGPSVVTGNEVIPVDFNNPANITATQGGTSPTTGLLTLASLGALPAAYPTFTSATSVNAFTVSPLVGKVIIFSPGSAALSNTSMQFPANPIDGQVLQVSANNTIATFNVSANTGQTIDAKSQVTAITSTTTAAYGYDFIWSAAKSTWFRLQ